jgi:hypothetical protein
MVVAAWDPLDASVAVAARSRTGNAQMALVSSRLTAAAWCRAAPTARALAPARSGPVWRESDISAANAPALARRDAMVSCAVAVIDTAPVLACIAAPDRSGKATAWKKPAAARLSMPRRSRPVVVETAPAAVRAAPASPVVAEVVHVPMADSTMRTPAPRTTVAASAPSARDNAAPVLERMEAVARDPAAVRVQCSAAIRVRAPGDQDEKHLHGAVGRA